MDFQYKEGLIEFKDLGYTHYVMDRNTADEDGKDKKKKIEAKDGKQEPKVQEKRLFEDFSLKIEPGTTNAIVGQSGFGKTTLLNLLFRIYDPSQGRVLLDGQDIRDLKLDTFRRYISIIPQNGILFNDTILFNLQYANPEASMEEIVEVAKMCEIHDKVLQMPDGYDSVVGDLGGKLSGGERQRILIARGLLKKEAQIFLFDEATSNLDSYTEKMITNELDTLMRGKTVIYCAHRLSSIINVDKIHVLKEGRVYEEGTHNELLSRPGSVYSEMWKNYLREKEEMGEEEDN